MSKKLVLILGKYTPKQWSRIADGAAVTREGNESGKKKTGFGPNEHRTFEAQVLRKLAAMRANYTMRQKSKLGVKDWTLLENNRATKEGRETNKRFMATFKK